MSTVLGLRAWDDDLVAVLFEFLDDDTKLAQSCTDCLYLQHWYTVVPDPAMRVTVWALIGAGGKCNNHSQDTPHLFLSVEKNYISEMTERCFLGEKRVLQPCTRLPLFRNLFYVSGIICLRSFFGSEVSCGSSMASAS